MKKEELIKKLENVVLPEIELQSHKLRLKLVLLNSGNFKKKASGLWTRRLVPLGLALSFAIAFAVIVVNPKLMEAKAMEIIRQDPQIQKFMKENGAVIKEVKIKGEKGYVLLLLPEAKVLPLPEEELTKEGTPASGSEIALGEKAAPQFLVGSIVRVNLKAKKVDNVEKLMEDNVPVTPLTKEEKVRAIEIIKNESEIKKMVPPVEETKISVRAIPSLKLHLEEDNDKIRVSPEPKEDKRASVILKFKGKQRTVTVNLTQEKVEGVIQGE